MFLSYLASLAKWVSVWLRTKWLWVPVLLQSLKDNFSHNILDVSYFMKFGTVVNSVQLSLMMTIISFVFATCNLSDPTWNQYVKCIEFHDI